MADDLRSAYLDLLMRQLEEPRYPSPTMLDRIEAAISTREEAEDYARGLMARAGESAHPGTQMLERIAGVMNALQG